MMTDRRRFTDKDVRSNVDLERIALDWLLTYTGDWEVVTEMQELALRGHSLTVQQVRKTLNIMLSEADQAVAIASYLPDNVVSIRGGRKVPTAQPTPGPPVPLTKTPPPYSVRMDAQINVPYYWARGGNVHVPWPEAEITWRFYRPGDWQSRKRRRREAIWPAELTIHSRCGKIHRSTMLIRAADVEHRAQPTGAGSSPYLMVSIPEHRGEYFNLCGAGCFDGE